MLNALLGECGQNRFVPAAVLLLDQLAHCAAISFAACVSGASPSAGRSCGAHVAERLLAQARHADHEELVEVRAEDRQELDPLEQRVGGVLGLFQHARS